MDRIKTKSVLENIKKGLAKENWKNMDSSLREFQSFVSFFKLLHLRAHVFLKTICTELIVEIKMLNVIYLTG